MRLGVRLPNGAQAATAENLHRVVGWAEDLGFNSVWIGDHVILPERVESTYPYAGGWSRPADTPMLDPLLALSLAGAWSTRLALGTSVLVLPLRHPVILAKQVATLDYLSGGRLQLGIGVGWLREEFSLLGVPFDDRGRRAQEMVRLMRALWQGNTVHFQGKFWQLAGGAMHPRPAQGLIPILWGGHEDVVLRRVASMGDGWQPLGLDIETLSERIGALHRLCARAGRDPASLRVTVRPGSAQTLTAGHLEAYHALGISEVIVDPPMSTVSLPGCRVEMERVASVRDSLLNAH